MPVRLLREGILDSDAVNSLSPQGEVFYRRLMSVVDDFGRFDGRPQILRSRLYALQLDRVREADIQRWITECVKAGLVRLYTVNSKPYLTFHKLNGDAEPRAKESKYPAPLDGEHGCEHPQADANGCKQPKASVPYSGSDTRSDTRSNSGSDKPPDPLSGGTDVGPASAVPIPPQLAGPEFAAAWADWLADRKARKKPVTERAAKQQLANLAPLGPAKAAECVRASIANGWQGLFPERFQQPARGQPPRTKAEAQDDYFAKQALDAIGDQP